MRDVLNNEHAGWCKISTDTVYNTLKTHTKYAHIVRGRSTLKDVERFRKGSVRESYEISLYERTCMGEPFIEKHAISTELSNVNREKHRRNSYRDCRTRAERLEKFVDAICLPCIPMSSTLHCYVNAKKLLNKKTFIFNCRERIRQCI